MVVEPEPPPPPAPAATLVDVAPPLPEPPPCPELPPCPVEPLEATAPPLPVGPTVAALLLVLAVPEDALAPVLATLLDFPPDPLLPVELVPPLPSGPPLDDAEQPATATTANVTNRIVFMIRSPAPPARIATREVAHKLC